MCIRDSVATNRSSVREAAVTSEIHFDFAFAVRNITENMALRVKHGINNPLRDTPVSYTHLKRRLLPGSCVVW